MEYTITDGTSTSTATITLTINSINDPPRAVADYASTAVNTPVLIAMVGNDYDVEGNGLSAVIQTGPSNGALAGAGGSRTYTPNAAYVGLGKKH